VGSNADTDEDETVEEFIKLGLYKPEETDGNEEHYPKLMRLIAGLFYCVSSLFRALLLIDVGPRYMISRLNIALSDLDIIKTAVDIVDLIIRTLDDAAKADSASAMARILQTARNIVELYAWTSPRKHDSEISSVPVLAG
ncbi:unnamed protein product, partial [Onchocerca flexuosa]|uniref:Mon2_C domain-containing protein n=1 Tax=Onchocerca flexuosa TaxID=387005 RepID=A0A183HEK4_9BILA